MKNGGKNQGYPDVCKNCARGGQATIKRQKRLFGRKSVGSVPVGLWRVVHKMCNTLQVELVDSALRIALAQCLKSGLRCVPVL